MTLRRRLTLTLVAATVPLVAGLAWLQSELTRRSTAEAMRGFIHARLDERGRERCEADPAHFGEPTRRTRVEAADSARSEAPVSRPPERRSTRHGFFHLAPLYAYDAQYHAASPAAPELPEEVRRGLDEGAEVASAPAGDGLLVAVRMAWDDGPCAIVASLHARPFRTVALPGLLTSALVMCAGLLAAVWLAAGPVVRRIRRLTGDVRRSVAGHYADPVPASGSDEVAELAHAFNDAASQVRTQLATLREREETLRSFLANTTHDLMLPLTVLQGHLSRLRQTAPAGSDSALLAAATEEAAYIGSLLSNLAAVAKLEAGEPLLHDHLLDLGALVERVVERHRPIAAARRIEIGHAVPEAVVLMQGDVTLIEQAVGNLVHNAVRHNHDGGRVAIVLDQTPALGFLLSISDDGPGVPEDQLERLGERRFRTDEARERHPEGLGLGLSIAREVAQLHGLQLRFRANQPSGLRVELEGPGAPLTNGRCPRG